MEFKMIRTKYKELKEKWVKKSYKNDLNSVRSDKRYNAHKMNTLNLKYAAINN